MVQGHLASYCIAPPYNEQTQLKSQQPSIGGGSRPSSSRIRRPPNLCRSELTANAILRSGRVSCVIRTVLYERSERRLKHDGGGARGLLTAVTVSTSGSLPVRNSKAVERTTDNVNPHLNLFELNLSSDLFSPSRLYFTSEVGYNDSENEGDGNVDNEGNDGSTEEVLKNDRNNSARGVAWTYFKRDQLKR
ncbi:hypothetical protein EVAR_58149_1 [Eumeta japonica]|uniref:Uncharacterized protein n=1 Tax=Eumeta variegata TaxID=151549 RepID=A0A4C1WZA4_EUMVA|nr:hypothetical protein EVAR_58149_1 [Eumeta japonica]